MVFHQQNTGCRNHFAGLAAFRFSWEIPFSEPDADAQHIAPRCPSLRMDQYGL